MKKLLLLLGIIVLLVKTENLFSQCLTVNAGSDQSMCSGPANLSMTYTPVYATTSYTVAPIAYASASYTGGSLALATNVDDIYSGVINIGFCFQFYGNTYTQCIVGSNGLISFDLTEASAYCNWSISSTNQLPNTSVPMNSIMGPYHDIDPSVNPSSGTSEVKYATYGSAPCRTFVVSWSNTPMFSCNSMIDNQQIILYESTNIIEVHMGNKPLCNSWNGGLAILGIQNSSGTVATAVSGKNCTQWSATNESYRFSPAGTEVTTVNWLEGVTVLSNSTSTSVNPSSTTTYTAQLTTPTCAGNIVVTDDVEVTITPGVTPTFAAIPNVCIGDAAPTLPTTSTNAITGTWSPVVSTAAAGTTTYTFTPTAGQCASTTTTTITVNASTVPTFAVIPSVCQNDAAPILPTTSTNGITGTWSPAVNTSTVGTTTYTFTPTAGQCASVVTTTITVDAPTVPTFTAIPNICQNDPAPTLSTNSTNTPAITGTWSPSVNTSTLGTTTYTFTPTTGQCATTGTINIVVSTPITPTFAAIPNVCQNDPAPLLPTNSTNSPSITGTWSPSVNTATTGTITYTFTPTAGVCAVTTTNTITVDTPVTPSFTAISNVCQNDVSPILPTSSTDIPAITGTWLPSVSTGTTGITVYTFTPTSGQCAVTTTNTITVDTPVTPSFAVVPSVCQNSAAPVLPTSSTDIPAIIGSWLPAVSTSAAGTTIYTFTPSAGQCAVNTTTAITVDPQITPTFTPVSDVCLNAVTPILPTASTNSPAITGTWSPAVSTSTAGTTTYTFTPSVGECATTTTTTILVTSQIIPTFTQIANMCQGSVAPALPSVSTNSPAMTGVWFPATISTAAAGTTTYTFTPDPGQCGTTTTMDITINAQVTPTFASISNICQNSAAPTLPTSSTNSPAILGTWSPTVSTSTAGTTTYTFTPSAGQCATTTTNTITIDSQVTPTFTSIPNICQNSVAPPLPTNSTNTPAITGTWSSAINTAVAGTNVYTFSPSAGECAATATMSVTIDLLITPTFAAIPNVCQNSVAPVLPTTSTNSITGVWSPTVNTTLAGTVTYTFTPTTGGCSTTATNTITVDPQITPLFTAITPICAGTVAPTLPANSNNSPIISGTWSPATVNNISSGTYTFTPSAGECATTATLTVTVNPLPIVFVVDPAPVCEPLTIDLTDPSLTAGSSGGTIGYYNDTNCTIPISSPSIIVGSGTYYIGSVSSAGCLTSMPVNVIINALPVASFTPNPQSLNAYNLTSVMENTSIGASNYEWYFMDGTESNTSDPSHTFPDSIYGEQLVILIAISPEGCRDTTEKAVTIIEELIFYVPNSFTPDGDKFNQTFQPVFTSGYDPFDFTMLIFNRWGEIVFESHDASSGWDGTYGDRLIKDDVLTWKIEFKITENDKRISATGSVTIAK